MSIPTIKPALLSMPITIQSFNLQKYMNPRNFLYLLDMSSKVYKLNFLDKSAKRLNISNEIDINEIDKMKLIY